MKAQKARSEITTTTESTARIAALTAAVGFICIANQLQLRRQSMTVALPPQNEVEMDFTGPVPFGFAFTEGHEATFHVPAGHRYVIEQLCVSSWAKDEHVDVQLLTRSPHMFRQITVPCDTEPPAFNESDATSAAAPIQVNGSTANTLLFSNGKFHRSSTVPPETYVQLWGYLEPVDDAEAA